MRRHTQRPSDLAVPAHDIARCTALITRHGQEAPQLTPLALTQTFRCPHSIGDGCHRTDLLIEPVALERCAPQRSKLVLLQIPKLANVTRDRTSPNTGQHG